MDPNIENLIEEKLKKLMPIYLRTVGFTGRKITDTPTEDLMTVNRKYVNLNGSTANRPVGSVIGQQYFDTSLNKPVFRTASGSWVDGAGTAS